MSENRQFIDTLSDKVKQRACLVIYFDENEYGREYLVHLRNNKEIVCKVFYDFANIKEWL